MGEIILGSLINFRKPSIICAIRFDKSPGFGGDHFWQVIKSKPFQCRTFFWLGILYLACPLSDDISDIKILSILGNTMDDMKGLEILLCYGNPDLFLHLMQKCCRTQFCVFHMSGRQGISTIKITSVLSLEQKHFSLVINKQAKNCCIEMWRSTHDFRQEVNDLFFSFVLDYLIVTFLLGSRAFGSI